MINSPRLYENWARYTLINKLLNWLRWLSSLNLDSHWSWDGAKSLHTYEQLDGAHWEMSIMNWLLHIIYGLVIAWICLISLPYIPACSTHPYAIVSARRRQWIGPVSPPIYIQLYNLRLDWKLYDRKKGINSAQLWCYLLNKKVENNMHLRQRNDGWRAFFCLKPT